MIELLMYITFILIVVSYISYFVLILINRKNKVSDVTGFDVSKDIISKYNSINIIETKGYFSFYNIRRKVIKLSSKCYYGTDLSSISISLIEAGISVLDDNKNKYINILKNIVGNLKILYILPIFSIFLNFVLYSITDAWVGILLLSLFSFITFILINIKTNIYSWLCDDLEKIKEISKNYRLKIMNYINIIIVFDKLILVGEVLMIIRYIMILLVIN